MGMMTAAKAASISAPGRNVSRNLIIANTTSTISLLEERDHYDFDCDAPKQKLEHDCKQGLHNANHAVKLNSTQTKTP